MSLSVRRAIIVCSLGYFIDVFDIQLFAILRMPSLTELGVSADQLATIAGYILNVQMLGMITGAFLWGWLGDRFGRLKALYGSILIYSIGTLACSFVQDPWTYGLLRFFTGFGLAGETGAAITLVAELMPPSKRGWGVTIISGIGFLGPAFAVIVSWFLPWRTTYVAAGFLGLLVLILRMRLVEPELFRKIESTNNTRGSLKLLAQRRPSFILLCCVTLGVPFCYCWNILNFFAPELSKAVLLPGEIFNQKICLLLFYVGTSCGDLLSGVASHIFHSRRKAIAALLYFGLLTSTSFLVIAPQVKIMATTLYTIYFFIGVAGGGWILFSTIAAEHFGTNIRATTAILTVNFVRVSVVIMTFALQGLTGFTNISNSTLIVGLVVYLLGFLALRSLRETHGLDLDYLENAGSEKKII